MCFAIAKDTNAGKTQSMVPYPVSDPIFRFFVFGVALFACLISVDAWSQFLSSPSVTPTGTGTGTTASSFSVTVSSIKFPVTPLAEGTLVIVDFYDPDGKKVSSEDAELGPGGVLTYPHPKTKTLPATPPIPTDAAKLGGSMKVRLGSKGGASLPLIWYDSSWFSGFTFAWKIDPLGFPGISTQHWFIEDTGGAPLMGSDAIFGARSLEIVDSGFDLAYSLVGGSLYNVTVEGDESFIRLSDGTYISFPDNSLFGTMEITPGVDSGLFDFFAIGVSGDWFFHFFSNYTDARGTRFSPFDAFAISVGDVPEPSTLALVGIALMGVMASRRRKPAIQAS